MNEITKLRLQNQQINALHVTSPTELVAWMGAMQAQDYEMSKWAIGARLSNYTDGTSRNSREGVLESALNDGDILRTHLLRPTWHLVAPTDIRWMLALTAPQIEKIVAGYYQRTDLDLATRNQANTIIEKALHEHGNLTREALMSELAKHGIAASDNKASIIMFHAELTGLVCSGVRQGKQITYALLDNRAPLSKPLHRDEALAELAKRYFQSHSPATLKDFSWWSGLSMTDARKAIDFIKNQLETLQIEKTVYYVFATKTIETAPKDIVLLPAFDEYLVSYTDRSAAIDPRFAKQAMTVNGIFSPIIVHHGQVIGVWKRKVKPKCVEIELLPFEPLSEDLRGLIQKRFGGYQDYLNGLALKF